MTNLHFSLSTPSSTRFGPRLGNIAIRRPDAHELKMDTPGLLASSSRGVIPHLSRDHHNVTKAVRWVNIPFETFLEHIPPAPTLLHGRNPLHTFLGFSPAQHVLLMSARDPCDERVMPSNSNGHVSAYSLRGVKRITPIEWRSYAIACQPDVVVALSDTPFTKPPYSQKRLTKSIERSTAWLADILRSPTEEAQRLNILVHMPGGASIAARQAFSSSLRETLYGKEAAAVNPLQCLDDGVSGYTFDLVPLRRSLVLSDPPSSSSSIPDILGAQIHTFPTTQSIHTQKIAPLLHGSLAALPATKLRIVNSTQSPHEILHLIQVVGIDLFDAYWAQRAADIGIALDFRFPVPPNTVREKTLLAKRDLGHNLYHSGYAFDFSSLAESYVGVASTGSDRDVCSCVACSPVVPSTHISHGGDAPKASIFGTDNVEYRPPFTRAYVHHLLHTHEMSAHSLLAMHNLSVLDAFFAGVRSVLKEGGENAFRQQVEMFDREYDEELAVFDEARASWNKVELARGKGRLAREKAKQEESTSDMAVDIPSLQTM